MKLKAWLAAAIVALFPLTAAAISVGPDEMDSVALGTFSGDFMDMETFTAAGNIRISFSVSGTGMEDDLAKVVWTSPDGSEGFDMIMGTSPAFGGGFLGTFTLFDGQMLEISAAGTGLASNTSLTLAWQTAAVPLPAAGWMFLSALGGMAILARKRARA